MGVMSIVMGKMNWRYEWYRLVGGRGMNNSYVCYKKWVSNGGDVVARSKTGVIGMNNEWDG